MSFQDVGKGTSTTRAKTKPNNTLESINEKNGESPSALTGIYGQLSESILQYQRNVGLLDKLNKQINTKADGPVLQTQYRVQVDVIKQYGTKIEKQLKSINSQNTTSSQRATYIKLNRDYQRVQTNFKNIQLDSKKKWDFKVAKLKEKEEEDFDKSNDTMQQMQMMQYQDKIQEDLIREREAEIRNINQGMHQVNEIYKDLADLVGTQQENIDTIEDNMQQAVDTAKEGLHHVEKANASQSNCVLS